MYIHNQLNIGFNYKRISTLSIPSAETECGVLITSEKVLCCPPASPEEQ